MIQTDGKVKAVFSDFRQNSKLITIACLVAILFVCIVHSLQAQIDCDFSPINGTFQNYNPVRRLFAGQTPFVDFGVYLGLGHLYLGGLATALFGGTYASSLTAFSLLTILSLVLISEVLGYSILGSLKASSAITLVLLLGLMTSTFLFTDGIFEQFNKALDGALSPGNSARFIRALIVPISILSILGLVALVRKLRFYAKCSKVKKTIILVSICSFVGAISFLFSNDYGLSGWLCIGLMLFVVMLARRTGFAKSIGLGFAYILFSGIMAFLVIALVTKGGISEWFSLTFGTGGYQSWYYFGANKNYYLYNIEYSFPVLLQGLLSILYISRVAKYRGSYSSCVRFGIPALMNMTAFCAANEYKLLTGYNLHEVSYAILFLTILFEVMAAACFPFERARLSHTAKVCAMFAACIGIAWGISECRDDIPDLLNASSSESYISELGGDLPKRSSDITSAEEFIGDEKVFSTYASALETVTDQFQPSRFDYIIHALGDEARADYLEDFANGDFRYAATIREGFNDWENWIRDGNWFFYRELYENYHPVFANSYELFWEKNAEGEKHEIPVGQLGFDVIRNDDGSIVLRVNCDSDISGTADVNIKYTIEKTGNPLKQAALLQECLIVEDTSPEKQWDSRFYWFSLPASGDAYIPIHVLNGYGEVTLISKPAESTQLVLESAELNNFFTVIYDCEDVVDLEYRSWE